jgi:hypothetical protein
MYASKSRYDFPGEEIWLDSFLALLFEEPCPLVAHTDFSTYIPSVSCLTSPDRSAIICFYRDTSPWRETSYDLKEAVLKATER